MKPTSSLFEAYLKCPTKCYLRSTGQAGAGNAYADWVREQNDAYRKEAVQRLVTAAEGKAAVITPDAANLKTATWRLAVDLPLETETMASRLHAVERVPSEGRGRPTQFIPLRFVFFNKLTKDDRLLVAFDALVLFEVLGREVGVGKIIHGDDDVTLKVKVASILGTVRKLTGKMSALLVGGLPPDLILNRHCGECEFRDGCRQKALEKDDLSLLGGMSAKERQKLRSKGIFTVTQLSYTFRPRRRPKRLRDKREKYHHSLKALAIREKKIHIVGSPELKIEGTPVYLDVEGLPDRDFYYLIGVRIGNGESAVQHSLWADTVEDEGKIWREFLALLETVEKPVLIHYGSYETTFLKHMSERHGAPEEETTVSKALRSGMNLLSHIFARIYFPTFSNALKDTASIAGARWRSPEKSGLQAIVWRSQWERTQDGATRDRLLTYNQDDCAALKILTMEVLSLIENAKSRADVDFADTPKNPQTERAAEIHRTFKAVLQSAYSDYSKSRIKLNADGIAKVASTAKKSKSRPAARPSLPMVKGQVVRVPRKRKCERHRDHPTTLVPTRKPAERSLIELAFTTTGCKKTVLRYIGKRGRCPRCGQTYVPPAFKEFQRQVHGPGFTVWAVYLRMVLRLSCRLITQATYDLFGIAFSRQGVEYHVRRCAENHSNTEKLLHNRLLQGPAIHIDETQISILGSNQYVWVLTDGKHVIFQLSESRETGFLNDLLTGYAGVIVSDFYGGYDALPYPQQKCLVHLIRDLNDDLWKNPFNEEFEGFVASIRNLILPILSDAQRFGSRVFHLRKHRQRVDAFYNDVVSNRSDTQELVAKYQKRFERYRESLFMFLERDGIPWNNNAAERGLRHLAVQRKISGAFSSKGAKDYIRLLGVAQSCRFQKKSFLGFLRSGLDDVDAYKEAHRGRTRRPAVSKPKISSMVESIKTRSF